MRRLWWSPLPSSSWLVIPAMRRAVADASGSPPSTEAVHKAFASLGLRGSQATSFPDIRKKYLELAKSNHPDVVRSGDAHTKSSSTSSSSHKTMSEINEAYDVLQRAHKSGILSSFASSSSSSDRRTHDASSSSSSYYDEPHRYQPTWGEDMPPEFYETMWEEMRQQYGGDPFMAGGRGGGGGGVPPMYEGVYYEPQNFGYGFYSEKSASGDSQSKRNRNEGRGGQAQQQQQQQQQQKQQTKQKTTTWSDEHLTALKNMYQDGKSFEFIANALGKQQADVVGEFNRWRSDEQHNNNSNHKQHRHQQHNHNRGGRGRGRGGGGGPQRYRRGNPSNMYSGLDMDEFDIADAFYDDDAYDQHGNPLDVRIFFGDDDDDDVAGANAQAFQSGRHYMHRGGASGGGSGGRGGNNDGGGGRGRSSHHHRGGGGRGRGGFPKASDFHGRPRYQ